MILAIVVLWFGMLGGGPLIEPIPTIAIIEPTPPPPGQETQLVDDQTRNALLALAMGLAIFSSSLALGIAYGIRRRIDQIAGPPEDED